MVWLTEIEAIDPKTGDLTKWCGISVIADTEYDARIYLDMNGYGYCKIVGFLVEELSDEEEPKYQLN